MRKTEKLDSEFGKCPSVEDVSAYDIEEHKHIFSAWAASRATSIRNRSFKVGTGREILEKSGFDKSFTISDLSGISDFNRTHAYWRFKVVRIADIALQGRGWFFTHGMAAKLINCYLKSRFVCGGFHDCDIVAKIHPPIDSVLLGRLAECDVGGNRNFWSGITWSTLNSAQYENVIEMLCKAFPGQPMWKIERYWQGFR